MDHEIRMQAPRRKHLFKSGRDVVCLFGVEEAFNSMSLQAIPTSHDEANPVQRKPPPSVGLATLRRCVSRRGHFMYQYVLFRG